jgi:hypothetical protein
MLNLLPPKFFAMKHILTLFFVVLAFAQLPAQNLPPAPTPPAPNHHRYNKKKIFDIKKERKKNRAEFGTPRHNTRDLKRANEAALQQSERIMNREKNILHQLKKPIE